MTERTPPANVEAEECVLGAMMISTGAIKACLHVGLRPDHFYRPRHQVIYTAILKLGIAKKPVDSVTVVDQLTEMNRLEEAGGREFVQQLPNQVPAPGNARHYAQAVLRAADLRMKREAATRVIDAVDRRDEDAISDAIRDLGRDIVTTGDEDGSPQATGRELLAYVQSREAPERFELPFPPLNALLGAGGLTRGEVMLLIGWTNQGKSIVMDQILTHFSRQKKANGEPVKVLLLTTEMTRLERAARQVSASSGIPYAKIMRRDLTEEQIETIQIHATSFPFGVVSADGWTVDRVISKVVATEPDVVAIDPLNLLRLPEGRSRVASYDAMLMELKTLANQARCAILAVSQLNMARNKEGYPPPPALRDIRDSGGASYLASQVLALYRKGGQDGRPSNDAQLEFLKVRNGALGVCKVQFEPSRFRFVLPSEQAALDVGEGKARPKAAGPYDEDDETFPF